MIVAIADTHAAIWYLFSDPRLGKAASAFIDDTIARGDHIGVSPSAWPKWCTWLKRPASLANALNDLHAAIADPKSVLQHIPLDEAVAMKMTEVSRQDIPYLPDRVIAATAQLHGIPLLSRDGRIRSSTIATIWQGDAR
jgi:PIN domain nuclease of toxin-antitoxin system